MANIVALDMRMSFKLDTGEMNGEKAVYKNVSLGGIKSDADANALAEVAENVRDLVPFDTAEVSLRRTDILEL
ncbi:MAG: DUF1659 domain-containing protein [Synergistaceae bacterium]|jgi:hypothetical protein|nr:DUF1659 domain-containing protein [Synergistaceae bacterium]